MTHGKIIVAGSLLLLSAAARADDAKPALMLRERHNFPCSADAVYTFGPDGRTLFVADSGVVDVWDAAEGVKLRSWGEGAKDAGACTGRFTSIAVSADGRFVATGGAGGIVQVWDAESGKLRHSIGAHVVEVHEVHRITRDGNVVLDLDETRSEPSEILSVALSPDGALVAAASSDQSISVSDAATGKVVHRIRTGSECAAIAISIDGKSLVSVRMHFAEPQPTVELWDVRTGELQRQFPPGREEHFGVRFLSLSQDDRVLAGSVGTTEFLPIPNVYLWDLKAGRQLPSITPLDGDGYATRVAVSPSGEYVASVGRTNRLVLWNVADRSRVATWEFPSTAEGPEFDSIQFSPDGKSLAVLARTYVPTREEYTYQVQGQIHLIELRVDSEGR
jgi:WD40 repeat protein